MDLIKVGFWRSQYTLPNSKNEMELPNPKDFIDINWDAKEKEAVITFLNNPVKTQGYRGRSNCRICGCLNGSKDFMDEKYVWPEGLVHYITDHNVKVPQEFIDYILSKK